MCLRQYHLGAQANFGEPEMALKSAEAAQDRGSIVDDAELTEWQRLAASRAEAAEALQERVQVHGQSNEA